MRIKVVSDGTRNGTKIVDADTGEGVNGVVAVRWEIGRDDREALVTLTTRAEVDLEGDQRSAHTDRPAARPGGNVE